MSEFFKRDIIIRILSVFCAVLLWFYVLNDVNPNITREYRDVKVRIVNERYVNQNDYIVDARDYTISVVLEGRKKLLDELDRRDISAEIDFSRIIRQGTNILPVERVQYNGPFGEEIKIRDYSPKTFDIEVDKINLNAFQVELITEGTPRKDYQMIYRMVKPNKIELRGPDSLIKTVESVKVTVDVTDLNRDVTIKKECKVINKQGQEVPELQADLPLVDVEIQVAKEVPLVYTTTGLPLKGFGVTGTRINPERVLVTGEYERLASLESILLDPVNLENISKDVEQRLPIKPPQGITIANGKEYTTFTASVEPYAKQDYTVNVKVENVSLGENLKYEIPEPRLTVGVMGLAADLMRVRVEDIKAVVNIEGLAPGTYKVPVRLTLPDKIYAVEEGYTVDVTVSKVPANPEKKPGQEQQTS